MEVGKLDKNLKSLRELIRMKDQEAHVESLLYRVNKSDKEKFTAVVYHPDDHIEYKGDFTKAEINNLGFSKLSNFSDFIATEI